jgi:hypothetical protein
MLDTLLLHTPQIKTAQDIDRELDKFTTAVKMTADTTIPTREATARGQKLPPGILTLIKFRNYVPRKYQRTRYVAYGRGLQLLNRMVDTRLAQHRNGKWQSFIRSLNHNSTNLWKITRYFKHSQKQLPPLLHQGTQYYMAQDKAGILATHFETMHGLASPRNIIVTRKKWNDWYRNSTRGWETASTSKGTLPARK